MKLILFVLTLPAWLPTLFAVASASLAIGIVVTVLSHAVKDRPSDVDWDRLAR